MALAPPAPCRKCGSTDRKVVPREFRDGTKHADERCGGCGKHFRFVSRSARQPLQVAAAPTPTPPAVPAPTPTQAGKRFMAATEMLDDVAARVRELLHEMQTHTGDEMRAIALHSVALAASANLSDANVDSLTAAIRSGKLPRATKAG